MLRLLAAAAAAAGSLSLAIAAPADASFDSCTYDAATRTVTATLATSQEGSLSVGAGGEIDSGGTPCGAATTANTDEVAVKGTPSSDTVTIDNSGAGGAFVKPGTSDEIHFDVDLSDETWCDPSTRCTAPPQVLKVIGTPGANEIRAGTDGHHITLINLDASADVDPDIRVGLYTQVDLDGSGGNDTLTGVGGSGTGDPVNVTLRGGSGDDHLVAGGDRDLLYPGSGDDTVVGSPSGGDTVSYADAPSRVVADVSAGAVYNDGFGDSDSLDRHVTSLRGSDHDDTLTSGWSDGGIRLDGGGGNDRIIGTPESDVLIGGTGKDTIDADPSGIDYGLGDRIYGGPGNDRLRGGAGPDRLYGGFGDDELLGARGTDPFPTYKLPFDYGDVLQGGPGNDVLDGGLDPDWYVFEPAGAREHDTIVERYDGGRDTLFFDYSDLDADGRPQIPTAVDLSSRGRRFATSGLRTLRTPRRGDARYIENVLIGGFASDRVVGTGAANVIQSGGGDDVVDCGGGRDTVDAATYPGSHHHLAHCEVVKQAY